MINQLKTVGGEIGVSYVLVLKREEYNTKYTEIPLHYKPSEGLIKQLLDLSGYHYAKVTKVTEEVTEYTYGEPEVQKVTTKNRNEYHYIPVEAPFATADQKDVVEVMQQMVFDGLKMRGDKF